VKENFTALMKYNFWEGSVSELSYYRKNYIDKIFEYTGNKLVKVLVGQRRTGIF
jgi:hypothetical protein